MPSDVQEASSNQDIELVTAQLTKLMTPEESEKLIPLIRAGLITIDDINNLNESIPSEKLQELKTALFEDTLYFMNVNAYDSASYASLSEDRPFNLLLNFHRWRNPENAPHPLAHLTEEVPLTLKQEFYFFLWATRYVQSKIINVEEEISTFEKASIVRAPREQGERYEDKPVDRYNFKEVEEELRSKICEPIVKYHHEGGLEFFYRHQLASFYKNQQDENDYDETKQLNLLRLRAIKKFDEQNSLSLQVIAPIVYFIYADFSNIDYTLLLKTTLEIILKKNDYIIPKTIPRIREFASLHNINVFYTEISKLRKQFAKVDAILTTVAECVSDYVLTNLEKRSEDQSYTNHQRLLADNIETQIIRVLETWQNDGNKRLIQKSINKGINALRTKIEGGRWRSSTTYDFNDTSSYNFNEEPNQEGIVDHYCIMELTKKDFNTLTSPSERDEALKEIEKINENQIIRAYRRLALRYHPDKSKGDGEKFKSIGTAYDILADATKRAEYNEQLRQKMKDDYNNNMLSLIGKKSLSKGLERAIYCQNFENTRLSEISLQKENAWQLVDEQLQQNETNLDVAAKVINQWLTCVEVINQWVEFEDKVERFFAEPSKDAKDELVRCYKEWESQYEEHFNTDFLIAGEEKLSEICESYTYYYQGGMGNDDDKCYNYYNMRKQKQESKKLDLYNLCQEKFQRRLTIIKNKFPNTLNTQRDEAVGLIKSLMRDNAETFKDAVIKSLAENNDGEIKRVNDFFHNSGGDRVVETRKNNPETFQIILKAAIGLVKSQMNNKTAFESINNKTIKLNTKDRIINQWREFEDEIVQFVKQPSSEKQVKLLTAYRQGFILNEQEIVPFESQQKQFGEMLNLCRRVKGKMLDFKQVLCEFSYKKFNAQLRAVAKQSPDHNASSNHDTETQEADSQQVFTAHVKQCTNKAVVQNKLIDLFKMRLMTCKELDDLQVKHSELFTSMLDGELYWLDAIAYSPEDGMLFKQPADLSLKIPERPVDLLLEFEQWRKSRLPYEKELTLKQEWYFFLWATRCQRTGEHRSELNKISDLLHQGDSNNSSTIIEAIGMLDNSNLLTLETITQVADLMYRFADSKLLVTALSYFDQSQSLSVDVLKNMSITLNPQEMTPGSIVDENQVNRLAQMKQNILNRLLAHGNSIAITEGTLTTINNFCDINSPIGQFLSNIYMASSNYSNARRNKLKDFLLERKPKKLEDETLEEYNQKLQHYNELVPNIENLSEEQIQASELLDSDQKKVAHRIQQLKKAVEDVDGVVISFLVDIVKLDSVSFYEKQRKRLLEGYQRCLKKEYEINTVEERNNVNKEKETIESEINNVNKKIDGLKPSNEQYLYLKDANRNLKITNEINNQIQRQINVYMDKPEINAHRNPVKHCLLMLSAVFACLFILTAPLVVANRRKIKYSKSQYTLYQWQKEVKKSAKTAEKSIIKSAEAA